MPSAPRPARLVFKREFDGFPKFLPCLVCGKPRQARSPAVRLHASCRKARRAQSDVEFIELGLNISTEEVV